MPGQRSTLWGLALLSCATLAYEVGLTRLYAVQQFYHFAFLVVSLAVMSLAASGVLLQPHRPAPPLPALAAGFAAAVLVAFLVLQLAPFDSYAVAWSPGQFLVLGLDVVSAGAPFLFSGWATAVCLAQAPSEARRPYAASLLGGALGPPVALAVTDLASGEAVVLVAAALGLAAAATLAGRRRASLVLAITAAVVVAPAICEPPLWPLRLSSYKPLAMARLLPDARLTETDWTASTRLDVIESTAFHIFPGLSLSARASLPAQHGAFLEGEGPMPLTGLGFRDPEAAALAGSMPSGLAYALRPNASVLILRPGAGLDAALALGAGARAVTVVMDEPALTRALEGSHREFTFGLAHDPRVRIVEGPQRSGLARLNESFDVILISLSEPFHPVRSGAFSLNEDYGLTVEAVAQAVDHLAPDGLLVITRWLGTPPSDETRAWATVLEATRPLGPAAQRLAAYRSMRTATIVAGRRAFRAEDLDRVREFLEANGFDPIHLPDLRPEELNRHNRLPLDVYYEAFAGLLADAASAYRTAEMDLRPATDDRPFYFQFFRWSQTADVLAQLGQTWAPFGGSGFLVLLLLLALLVILSAGLIALASATARPDAASAPRAARATAYFAAIGLGFLIVEVTLIQQFGVLLDRPAYSLATVLAVLLLASGLGSLLSGRVALDWALPAIALTVVGMAMIIPGLTAKALSWPFAARAAVVALVLLPLGLGMGIPFARGLQQLRRVGQPLVPWAWTANGAASGLAGVLTAVLTLSIGFRATLMIGAAAYLVAWLVRPRAGALLMAESGLEEP